MKFKKTKQIGIALLFIALFQILLLVNLPLASSYSISQQEISVSTQTVIIKDKKINNLSLKQIFSLNIFSLISAVDDLPEIAPACCPVTNEGALCQQIIAGEESATKPTSCANPIPAKCDLVSDCQRGCCFDPTEGLCSSGSPKQACTENGGEWNNDDSCLIPQCIRGCCVLGNNAQFVTERHCENLASLIGTEKDFRDISSEPACLAVVASYDEGACVLDEGSCRFTTERTCLSEIHGDFYGGYLCSAEEIKDLGSECEKQESISCVEGKDEIYWLDSCGNRENLYSSDKDFSWNLGRVLDKDLSCNPTEGNIGSRNCGNCNLALSSRCSEVDSGTHVSDGDFVCKDLRCDYNGKTYKNGESWCIYEGSIGEENSPFGTGTFSSDLVGSEHWRAYCNNGDVEIDRCGEYRGKICTQSVIEEGEFDFSLANCVINEASSCVDITMTYFGNVEDLDFEEDEDEIERYKDEMGENCVKNPHCMVKEVDVSEYFDLTYCVPKYTEGADLSSGTDESACEAFASLDCTGIEQRKTRDWGIEWVWVANKDCTKNEFAEKMNDFCVSIGDCGSYINYIGEGTNNINLKESKESVDKPTGGSWSGYSNKNRAGEISWEDYLSYKDPVSGKYVQPQDIERALTSVGISTEGSEEYSEIGDAWEWINLIPGRSGALLIGASAYLTAAAITAHGISGVSLYSATAGSIQTGGLFSGAGGGSLAGSLQFAGVALIGFVIGSYLGEWIAQETGLQGEAVSLAQHSGGFIGASAALMYFGYLGPAGWAVIGVALVINALGWAFGLGKTRDTTVEFECLPWQAPTGEANCGACNEDPLRPCTPYRCEAIGQTCRLLNEELDTENPTCESIPYEPNPPEISPGMTLDENSNFENTQTNSVEIKSILRSDGCLQEFTTTSFTLITDEAAQCKYDFVGTSNNFNDKANDFPKESNAFTYNHTFEISMPSLDSLSQYEIDGDLTEFYGNSKLYVRCQDYWENFNINEYLVNFCIHSGPDENAVWHELTRTIPENGDYLPYNTTNQEMKIWLNEPAECKYDTTADLSYDLMTNSMSCITGISHKELFGWRCGADLVNLTAGENNFYIKCKDQPWKNTSEDHLRNVNIDDYSYTLYVTENPLNITSVLPKGIVTGGAEPISIDLEAYTSGGMSRGESTCYYDWAGNWVMFFDTFSNHHKQEGLNLMGGNFNIPIKCEDNAQNIAYNNATFELDIDSSAPNIARVYREGGSLRLITDEDAICYYHNLESCNPFVIENSSSMTIGFSKSHSVNWNPQQTYYVKCEDAWGNMNPDCSIVVRPSSII